MNSIFRLINTNFYIFGCWLLPQKFSIYPKNNCFPESGGLQPPSSYTFVSARPVGAAIALKPLTRAQFSDTRNFQNTTDLWKAQLHFEIFWYQKFSSNFNARNSRKFLVPDTWVLCHSVAPIVQFYTLERFFLLYSFLFIDKQTNRQR